MPVTSAFFYLTLLDSVSPHSLNVPLCPDIICNQIELEPGEEKQHENISPAASSAAVLQ